MEKDHSGKQKPLPNNLLKHAREQRGWTHDDIANLISLPDEGMMSRWERGVTFPRPHYRRALAELFGMSLAELGLIQNKQNTTTQIEETSSDETAEETPGAEISDTSFYKLPPQATSFIGREQDILDVQTLLTRKDIQLVTILGSGGIGKTRLGIQVAMQMQEHFCDGICFVPLASVNDPTLFASAIANELNIYESKTMSLPEQIKKFFIEKEFLLVLDNFEHLIAAAPLVAAILDACPHLKVLVTSREVLHLQAEHQFTLSTLPLPTITHPPIMEELRQWDVIALFEHRAQALIPTFQVTPQNAHAIVELCTHLDGLPLAVELAASRIKLLPPQALLARISQRFRLLKTDVYAIPDRQRTLFQTIKWSYDLLSSQEQEVFRHLCVFVNGASLESLEAFFAARDQPLFDILDQIAVLVDKSLLECVSRDSDVSSHIKMLEVIREYGIECMGTHGELAQARHLHAQHYLHLVEQAMTHLISEHQSHWLSILEPEMGNLRTALSWLIEQQEVVLALRFCETFGKFCGLQGYWSEERHWLRKALDLPQIPEGKAIRARILRRAGHLAYRLRDLVTAYELHKESITLSREIGDAQNLAGALSGLGWVLYRQNATEAASQFLHESVEAAQASGDTWALANALESMGRFLYLQTKIDEAYLCLEKSITLSRSLADKETIARTLTTYVAIEIAQGRFQKAATLAQESFDLAQELGTKPLIALTLQSLGDAALAQEEYELARNYFEKSITIAKELGDESAIIDRQRKLGHIRVL